MQKVGDCEILWDICDISNPSDLQLRAIELTNQDHNVLLLTTIDAITSADDS